MGEWVQAARVEREKAGRRWVITIDTLLAEKAYVESYCKGREPQTVTRLDETTFQAVLFPVGEADHEEYEFDWAADGWRVSGVHNATGWYVVDPGQPEAILRQAYGFGVLEI